MPHSTVQPKRLFGLSSRVLIRPAERRITQPPDTLEHRQSVGAWLDESCRASHVFVQSPPTSCRVTARSLAIRSDRHQALSDDLNALRRGYLNGKTRMDQAS